MLFTEKYAPKSLDAIEGNDTVRTRVRQWMLNWLASKHSKPLLIWGPPGIGKTAIAYVLSYEYELDIIEMNASELRNKSQINRVAHGAMLADSLTGRGKIILIDDVDSIHGRNDYGGSAAIASMLREASVPIILTASDAWDKKLSTIRSECETLEMKRVGKGSVKKVLDRIISDSRLAHDRQLAELIAEQSNGDVRSAINDLQAMHAGRRDREKDIFQRVRRLFKATTLKDAREATAGDVDIDLLKLWIDENIPVEYEDGPDIASAFSWLSRADIFEGRIRKTYWKYLRYALDLQTAGVALSKGRQYMKFTRYSFPSYLTGMSSSMQRRALLKSIGAKLGALLHASRKDALHYLPLLRELGKGRSDALAALYGLEEGELAFIMETSPRRVRAKK